MAEERYPWERRPGETAKAYEGFRAFRDLPASTRTIRKLNESGYPQAKNWSSRWDWHARATAWDDHVARQEDEDRLSALRSMHSNHQRAARAIQQFALAALSRLDIEEASPADVARLLELGARLERVTLSVSVEELQGRPPLHMTDDPWTRIANELSDTPAT